MKVTGSATLHADRVSVWRALNDPAVLVRTIPGCRRLESVGPDAYKMTVEAGVASIKGIYEGQVRLTDFDEPGSFVLVAEGAGTPGTVSAKVDVVLSEIDASTTDLAYDAEAVVGGMIGGVGQRLLAGVAKKTAGEFFGNVDDVLSGAAHAPPSEAADGANLGGSRSRPAGEDAVGAVFDAPTAAGATAPGFAAGVAVGALAALVGAIVGGLLAGRRRG